MAVLTILSVILVRNLKVEKPGKIQLALESFIGFLNDFFMDTIGKAYEGPECNGSPGDHEPCAHLLFRIAEKRPEEILFGICRAYAYHRAH